MDSHKYLLALQNRIILEKIDDETKNYIRGLEGEVCIKGLLDKYKQSNYIYNLNLNYKNRVQIDFLVISDDTIFHLEVKHYSGDYSIHEGQLLNEYGTMFYTPFQQIKRAHYELNHVITHYNINRELKSFLVFSNPKFTLKTHIPNNINVLLPTELHKLQYMFKNNKSIENSRILKIFKSNHSDFSHIYNNVNKIPIEHLRKGLKCPRCKRLYKTTLEINKKYLVCEACLYKIARQNLYLYNLKELYICKKEPFTLNEAQKWCQLENSLTIRRVVEKYFKSIDKNPKKYYLDNEEL